MGGEGGKSSERCLSILIYCSTFLGETGEPFLAYVFLRLNLQKTFVPREKVGGPGIYVVG